MIFMLVRIIGCNFINSVFSKSFYRKKIKKKKTCMSSKVINTKKTLLADLQSFSFV